ESPAVRVTSWTNQPYPVLCISNDTAQDPRSGSPPYQRLAIRPEEFARMSRKLRRLFALHEKRAGLGPIVRRVHLTRDGRVTLIAAVVRGIVSVPSVPSPHGFSNSYTGSASECRAHALVL